MNKVLVLTNSINGLYSFRKELITELIDKEYKVSISAPNDTRTNYFKELGCSIINTPINRRGINPIDDIKLLINYLKSIKTKKPNIVLTYTIKPNVYGGIACRLLKVPYIANITGLGTAIENKGFIRKVSLFLYKMSLRSAKTVFFQNKSNKSFFIDNKIVSKEITKQIPGSGVNLKQHAFEDYPSEDDTLKFLFIGRIMKAKGVNELFDAVEIIRKEYSNIEFHFIGGKEEDFDEKIHQLSKEEFIFYHGRQNNVHPFIKNSHVVINPSHHEGMSNVLLESASTGRPVIASNIPGCKEIFDDGITGLGFIVKNVDSLVNTITKFIQLPHNRKKEMGLMGRAKMEKEFDRNIVIKAYMKQIESLMEEF